MKKFSVWAPKARKIDLIVLPDSRYTMKADAHHIFSVDVEPLPDPADYMFLIDGIKMRPDPCSRWQPLGVHGPSRVYVDDFKWTDGNWKGIAQKDFIIYELHVGTFTSDGTFEAIIGHLPYLKELGVTAIELMPVIEFPGNRNWGYDGVFPFAPHHLYGGPIGLKKLIDACHEAEIGVILDVVYNHLGPEGNYLNEFGFYFTDRYKTPWGDAVNYDEKYCDSVRDYVIENALYWLTEYHVDGLRLDAIQAIFDFSPKNILADIHDAFRKKASDLNRQAYLFAESELNDTRVLDQTDGQWSDDFHHSLYTYLTKSTWGYFIDFGKLSDLAKALQEGFIYTGQWSEYRKRKFGTSSKGYPGEKFIINIENHDQIGNAFQGKRLGSQLTVNQYKLATTLLFCAPSLPLLFMGQEWSAATPFLFFTSYEDEKLAKAVKIEYQKEFQNSNADPQDVQRFLDSKLKWDEHDMPEHQEMLKFYKKMIELRKKHACLNNGRMDLTKVDFDEQNQWLVLRRDDPNGSAAVVVCNFKDTEQKLMVHFEVGNWGKLRVTQPGSVEVTVEPFSANLYQK